MESLQLPNRPLTRDLKLTIFSYLSGTDLIHKIALINKEVRVSLPNKGLLDQDKVANLNLASIDSITCFHLTYSLSLLNAVKIKLINDYFQNELN